MNLANKITISRIVMSIIIIILLLFPFYQVGIKMPNYIIDGRIIIDLKYIVAGIIFIVASITDFFDGYIARKNNLVTDFGKVIDAISDKILTNSLLIILSCNGMIAPIITVVIVIRDTVVDSLKMMLQNKEGSAIGAIKIAKYKTACLMIGIAITLFYNMPFELFNLRVSDFMLVIAAVLSVISGFEYYYMARGYLKEK